MPKKITNHQETISLGATIRSAALNVQTAWTVGYAIRTSGTAAGSWSVQYSNDYVPGVDDPTSDAKWDTYSLSTSPPDATGAAQTFGIALDSYEYAYARIKFTRTSGTGSAFIATQMKG